MDIATLALVHAILEERGIRRAAKVSGRPPASVSAALKRFEAAIAVPLVRRERGNLVPTLEAQSRMGDLAAANEAIQSLLQQAPNSDPQPEPPRSNSFHSAPSSPQRGEGRPKGRMSGTAGSEIAEKAPSSPRIRSALLPAGEKRETIANAHIPGSISVRPIPSISLTALNASSVSHAAAAFAAPPKRRQLASHS
jgi:hypothetical protein